MDLEEYDPINALDAAIFPLEIFERIWHSLDAKSLLAFGETCRFFLLEAEREDHWHRLFDAQVFYLVPSTATTWKEKYQFRKPFEQIVDAIKIFPPQEADDEGALSAKSIVVIPPGELERSHLVLPDHIIGLEGYTPRRASAILQNQPQQANPAAGKASQEPADNADADPRPHLITRIWCHTDCSFKNLRLSNAGSVILHPLNSIHVCEYHIDNCELSDGYMTFYYSHFYRMTNCVFKNSCISLRDTSKAQIENCTFEGFTRSALTASHSASLFVRRSRFVNCESHIISCRNSTDVSLIDCVIENVGIRFPAINSVLQPFSNKQQPSYGALSLQGCKIVNFHRCCVSTQGSNITIKDCEFIHGGTAIQVSRSSEASTPCVIQSNTFRDCKTAISAHSGASLLIDGNKFSEVKVRAIRIASDCQVQVLENNEYAESVAIRIDQETFDAAAYKNAAAATPDEIPARIHDAIANNKCTFTVTETDYVVQRVYKCHTCELNDNQGVCETCASVCHRGHDLEEQEEPKRFYCDCPGADRCSSCK